MNLLLHKYLLLMTISQPPSYPLSVELWSILITRNINLFKSSKMRLEPRLLLWIHCQIVKNWLCFKLSFFKNKKKTINKNNTKNKTINKNNTKNKTKQKKNKRLLYPVWHLSQQETLSGQVPVRPRDLTSLETAADAHRWWWRKEIQLALIDIKRKVDIYYLYQVRNYTTVSQTKRKWTKMREIKLKLNRS